MATPSATVQPKAGEHAVARAVAEVSVCSLPDRNTVAVTDAKQRTPIPNDVADAVQFRSDRTCCVCRHPGKAYQLHHINEDPGDHDADNLAALCLDCHNLTQIRGGFGRRLTPGQVRLYRDEWYDLVSRRRPTGLGPSDASDQPADSGDQEVLDDLLYLLSRESVGMISRQDFVQSWPRIMINPVHVLLHEYQEVENEFGDQVLEQARAELLAAADNFAEQEALHGFVSSYDDRRRIPGYTGSEAEGIPEREEAIRRHSSAIRPAAQRFLEAHDNLIRVARGRGYSVDGLKGGRHPRALEIDAIYEE